MLEDQRITKVANSLRNLDDSLSERRDLEDRDRDGQYEKKRGGADVACITGTEVRTDGASHQQAESHCCCDTDHRLPQTDQQPGGTGQLACADENPQTRRDVQLVANLQGLFRASYCRATRNEKCLGQQDADNDGSDRHCELLSIACGEVIAELAHAPRIWIK